MKSLAFVQLTFLFACSLAVLGNEASQQKCALQENKVCLCNRIHCDWLDLTWPAETGESVLIQSSIAGARFDVSKLSPRLNESWFERLAQEAVTLEVDTRARHQQILGWGGAFTDAAGYNIRKLSKPVADELIESYYSHKGLQYNIGRVPIGGTDFSTREYSYDDSVEPDWELKEWRLAPEDLEYKIPYIQQVSELVKENGVNLKLFSSPWSPPRWMKTNNNFTRGFLIDDDKVYRSYAEYLMKFYDAYRQHGIKFWGGTVQNEPLSTFAYSYFFTGTQMDSHQMRKFIANYLGPALEARNFTRENFKLIIGDDNLGMVNSLAVDLLEDPEVAKYVSGFAYHWYEAGFHLPHALLSALQERIRDKVEFTMMSEACNGWQYHDRGVRLGSWKRAEAYAYDIIEGLTRNSTAWIDWNLALDLQGGPNWAHNTVDSPILVNAEKDEFYKQPMYYALGHFSKFMKPGSVRVSAHLPNTPDDGNLMTVATLNTETGHLVVNILNRYNSTRLVDLRGSSRNSGILSSNTLKSLPLVLEPNSINTVVIKL